MRASIGVPSRSTLVSVSKRVPVVEIALDRVDCRLEFLDRAVLHGLVTKGDPPLSLGQRRLKGGQLVFGMCHQR